MSKMRNQWDTANMADAVRAVMEGRFGYVKASKTYDVPQTTLERKVKKCREGHQTFSEVSEKEKCGVHPVFTREQEQELVDHILLMESRMFGLTVADVRRLAFQLVEKNGIPNRFNKEKEMAGKHWIAGLKMRFPQLSLRTPEQTSLARVMGFNKMTVNAFFELLHSLYEKYNFTPDRIFNVDETGVSTVPNKLSKVMGLKGKRQIGGVTSAERGTLTTAEICMSASGNFMPVMFVFPRVKRNPELLDGAPPATTAEFQASGWMTADVFVKWFDRFIAFSNPTPDNPVLLILDGHATHTKSLEFIEKARQNHVHVLCIPPHCSHRLQPLDVSFMKPVSSYYSEEVSKWLRDNPGRPVTIRQVAMLFGRAFTRAASMNNAINGFRKTGIWPFNRDIFPESDFAAAETTDRPLQYSAVPPPDPETAEKETDGNFSRATGSQPSTSSAIPPPDPQTDGNTSGASSTPSTPIEPRTTEFPKIAPSDIVQIPHAVRTQNSRKKGRTAILTESPYKRELEAAANAQKGQKRKKKNENPATSKETKKKKPRKWKAQKRLIFPKQLEEDNDCESSPSEGDDSCIICQGTSFDGGSVKCNMCGATAHESCTKLDDSDLDDFLCDLCLNLKRQSFLK